MDPVPWKDHDGDAVLGSVVVVVACCCLQLAIDCVCFPRKSAKDMNRRGCSIWGRLEDCHGDTCSAVTMGENRFQVNIHVHQLECTDSYW